MVIVYTNQSSGHVLDRDATKKYNQSEDLPLLSITSCHFMYIQHTYVLTDSAFCDSASMFF